MSWCKELSGVKSYIKLKHAGGFAGRLSSVFSKIWQLYCLRAKRYDLLVYVGDGSTPYARRTIGFLHPIRAIAFTGGDSCIQKGIELVHSPKLDRQPEYLEILSLAKALGIPEPYQWKMPLLHPPNELGRVASDPNLANRYSQSIGIHLSARRPRQQWPTKNFASLIELLCVKLLHARILITWSPGRTDDKLHPGDDRKADELLKLIASEPLSTRVQFKPTPTLTSLLKVQSECDVVFCSDGGAMHLAAALGKPVVAMFGDSDHRRWRPIGYKNRIITTRNHDVREIDAIRVASEICILLSHGHDQ